MKTIWNRAKYDFTDQEIREAANANRLLSLELEFTRKCNYRCPYCYAVEDSDYSEEMEPDEIRSVLKQAAELGARKIVILGGEPLLYPELPEMLDEIVLLGMVPEVFTNGSLISGAMAKLLFDHKTRVIVKLNTLDPVIHDELTGMKDSLNTAFQALKILKNAGYDDVEDMLGCSTILSSVNIDCAPEMWKKLRTEKLLPYFECITPQGRMLEHLSLLPPAHKLKEVFEEIAGIDAGIGRHWIPQPPLAGQKCFRHLYSCLIKSNGDVMPCVGLTALLGNIRRKPLREILGASEIIRQLKDHRKYIKAPCRDCAKAEHCYGCRGTAWQMTGDYLAADPSCWFNTEKNDEIMRLPYPAKRLIPHQAYMALPDELVRLGDGTGVTESVIRKDNLFLQADGTLSREALIEYAAQSAAALDSFENGGVISDGLLLEVSRAIFSASARAGDRLTVEIVKDGEFDVMRVVKFRIQVNGTEQIAEGTLKLCVGI